MLEAREPRLYRVLRWILSSNRAHLQKLPPHKQVKDMATPHQYLLFSNSPEKEARFRVHKQQHPTVWAFHGSAIENWYVRRVRLCVCGAARAVVCGECGCVRRVRWNDDWECVAWAVRHAILRGGLRNLSNTDLMTCGAVYGAGIYLSPRTHHSTTDTTRTRTRHTHTHTHTTRHTTKPIGLTGVQTSTRRETMRARRRSAGRARGSTTKTCRPSPFVRVRCFSHPTPLTLWLSCVVSCRVVSCRVVSCGVRACAVCAVCAVCDAERGGNSCQGPDAGRAA
jgi:hypothetical protein